MEVKFNSSFSYNVYKDYIHFNLNKGKYRRLIGIIFSIIIALGLLASVFLIVIGSYDSLSDLLPTLTLLAIIFIYIFMYFFIPKIAYNSAKKFASIVTEYIFKEDEVTMTSNSPEYSSNSITKYSTLHKVYETNKYIYLYILPVQAYVVEKGKITDSEVEQIRNVVSKCIPEKRYIIRN